MSKRTHAVSCTHNTHFDWSADQRGRCLFHKNTQRTIFFGAFSFASVTLRDRSQSLSILCASNQSVIFVDFFLAGIAVFCGSLFGLHAVLFSDGAKGILVK